jgi:hypothetical protein
MPCRPAAIAAAFLLPLWLSFTGLATAADSAPPKVSGLAPAGGSTVVGSVDLSTNATDDVGVTRVTFRVDGVAVGSDSTAPYSVPWNSTTVADGTHTISARARDTSGKTSTLPDVANTVLVHNAPDAAPPTVQAVGPLDGTTVSGPVALTASATDDVAVSHVTFRVDGVAVGSDSTAPYTMPWDSTTVADGTHTISARARDISGKTSALPDTSSTLTVDNSTSTAPDPGATDPPPAVQSFFLQSPHSGRAHDDAYCAANVTPTTWEPRPENATANNTMGSPSTALWGASTYWTAWGRNRDLVTGAFTGRTTQQFQWAACKWGLDEDVLRAVGVQETEWRQASVGDNCGVPGQASYSIIQVKNRYCNGALAWGGYPETQRSTALALDFYGAYIRSCYDGAFNDGGPWLYGGQSVDQIAASKGWDYVLWGCVGSWYSGGWYDSGAQSYIAAVQKWLADRTWTRY